MRPWVLVVVGSLLAASGLVSQVSGVPAPAGPGAYTGPSSDRLPAGTHLFADDVHKQCGKYALVFRNKDLREDASDFIHAQGTFFIQFQAVGKGSSEIKRFSFSFGATNDLLYSTQVANCNEAVPENPIGKGTGGAYLLYYRSDFNGEDGFFVPIKTNNVPDGEYGAAVHAYDANGIEVARAWARAKVDNCKTDTPNCQNSESDIVPQDRTLPWPMILPGDGAQTNKEDGQAVAGLTVEFPEKVVNETLFVYLNGDALTMEPWASPARDADVAPLNDDQNCAANVRFVCERVVYGPGFRWIGEVKAGDVLRVAVEDLNKNYLERTIHVGAATSGGTVELEDPEIALEILNDDDVFIRPGDEHEFNARLSNIGGGEAHVNLLTNVSREAGRPMAKAHVEAYWAEVDGTRTDHVLVPRGEDRLLKVRVRTQSDTPEDHYYVNGILEYDAGGQQQYKSFDAIVDVNKEASGNHQHLHDKGIGGATNSTNETGAPLGTGGAESPSPAVATFLGVMALAVIVVARRLGR